MHTTSLWGSKLKHRKRKKYGDQSHKEQFTGEN